MLSINDARIAPMWLAVLILAPGCRTTPEGPPPGPIGTRRLPVGRHASVNLSAARADAILQDMTTVIQFRDRSEDVGCAVEFVREGDLGTFSTGTGSVNGPADFGAITALPTVVNVVNQINWCGTFSPNIIGCAPLGGDSMAVVRFTADQEGILWLHEYGHLQGLEHRDEPGAVMHSFVAPDHRSVDETECAFYEP